MAMDQKGNEMTAKKSGNSLGQFMAKSAAPTAPVPTSLKATTPGAKKKRGEGERVAIAVRLEKEDWYRLHDYVNRQNTTMQELIIESLSATLVSKGFPPISGK